MKGALAALFVIGMSSDGAGALVVDMLLYVLSGAYAMLVMVVVVRAIL
jgi:hypothetical protein